MNNVETLSNVDSSSEQVDPERLEDLINTEPLYHVLAEFFQTSDNKNVTTVLNDICNELKLIRIALSK